MNSTKPRDRFHNLLNALQRVNEDILSLGDDLLLSIRPPDKQSIETGYQALVSYNEVLAGFTTWFQSYQRLVGSEHVASLLASVPEPGLLGRAETNTTYPSQDAHQLGEDFRYTKPREFEIEGYLKEQVTTWREVYIASSKALICRHPDFLARISACESLKERGGKPYFSPDREVMRDPLQVSEAIFAEGNLSANGIKDVIGHLMDVFGINKAAFHVYLQSRERGD
jgi:hypothetical protein